MKGEIMIQKTPLIKTTFTIPSRQGKDIYSPVQNLIVKNKFAGMINGDKLELSTYNRNHAEDMLNVLSKLKAKFKMNTVSE